MKNKAYFSINMFQKDLDNYKHLQNNINNLKKAFENKADNLDDFLEWEGKSKNEIKEDKEVKEEVKEVKEDKKDKKDRNGISLNKNKKPDPAKGNGNYPKQKLNIVNIGFYKK